MALARKSAPPGRITLGAAVWPQAPGLCVWWVRSRKWHHGSPQLAAPAPRLRPSRCPLPVRLLLQRRLRGPRPAPPGAKAGLSWLPWGVYVQELFPKSKTLLRHARSQSGPARPQSIAISFQDITRKKQSLSGVALEI